MIDKQSIEDVLGVSYYSPESVHTIKEGEVVPVYQTGTELMIMEKYKAWEEKVARMEKLLTASEYSDWVEGMVITTGQVRLLENTLGLVGEAGEFAEKIKKYVRDGTYDRDLWLKELGDVVFYVAALANYLDSDLQEVMDLNVAKLEDRKSRGVLQGSGDNR